MNTDEYNAAMTALYAPRSSGTESGFTAQDFAGKHQTLVNFHSDGRVESKVTGVMHTGVAEVAASKPAPWLEAHHPVYGHALAPHEVTTDSIVTVRVPGSSTPAEMTLEQAYAADFLKRPNEAGTPAQAAPQAIAGAADESGEPTHPDLVEEALPDAIEAQLGEVIQVTGSDVQVQAAIEIAETGEISFDTIKSAAAGTGIDPLHLKAAVDQLRPHFEKQADDVAAAFGVDPEAVWTWAHEKQSGRMKDAMMRHLMMRNTQGYRALAQEYVQNLDTIDPDMILNAELGDGIQVEREGQGTVVLMLPDGRKVTWSEALALNIIKLSRR